MSTTGQILSREEVSALVEAMQSGGVDTSSAEVSSSAVQPYSLIANDSSGVVCSRYFVKRSR
jgi:hypothetical protein